MNREHLAPINSILERFIDTWRSRPEMVGVYLTGSWALNLAKDESDIDLRVVISNECMWREKQSYLWEGKKVNAWALSANHLSKSFVSQWRNYSKFDARSLNMAMILTDESGTVLGLKKEAKLWMQRPFAEATIEELMLMQYDCISVVEELGMKAPDNPVFFYDYLQGIEILKKAYFRRFSIEETIGFKFLERMLDPEFCKTYGVAELPHQEFGPLLRQALSAMSSWDDLRSLMMLKDFVISFFPTMNIKELSIRLKV